MQKNRQPMDMVNGPLLKNILLFSFPLMISNLLQIAFNAADTIVVGKFSGQAALAAVGATGSIVNLIASLFIGLSTGANIVIARQIGRREEESIHASVHTSYFMAIFGGILMTVIGMLCSRSILSWMGTPADIIDLSALYMRIYFAGSLAILIYNFGAAVLRSIGDTARPTMYLMISGVLNVVLNLIFVIGLKMSVEGVALATVISETVSAVLVTAALVREKSLIHLDFRKIRPHAELSREILRIGIPAGLQSMMWSISNVAVQSAINSFGSVAVAGNSAAQNIEGFVYITMGAFSQAAITFTSQNAGAKNIARIRRIMWMTIALTGITCSIVGFGLWRFEDFFLSFYTNDAAVVEAGTYRMFYVVLFLFINGILDAPAGSMRGMGYSTTPTIIMLLGIVAVRVVYIMTVFRAMPTLPVLYMCFPLSWVITTLLMGVIWNQLFKKFTYENR